MREYKLRTQAQVCIQINIDNGLFFDIFEYATIKTHSKHVPITFKVSCFHLDPFHSKT